MQELHEFRWTEDDTQEGRYLDLRIIESGGEGSGSYTIQNLKSPDQTCQVRSPQDAVDQFGTLFERVS